MAPRRTRAIVSTLLASVLSFGCSDSDPVFPEPPDTPVPPLTLTGVSPSIGPMAGGTSVTITGTNFTNVTSVTVGGSELGNRTVLSETQILGQTPVSTSSGEKDVVVTSSSHGTDTCSGCFSYLQPEPPPPSALDFAALGLGNQHTCALTVAGAAYCWGDNQDGQLGNGTTRSSTVPVPVSGELTFASLEVGAFHACGLTGTGAAYCWGHNEGGALGNGTTTDRSTPVAVTGGFNFVVLSAGWDHTCGVTAEDAAYCWGLNLSGELGDGTNTTSTVPVPVGGSVSFTAVTAGSFHTCGLTAEGTAYCWGNNTEGELGDGTTTDHLSALPVEGGLSFVALQAGFGYTCGVTDTADAYCWGYNHLGKLGTSSPLENVRSSPGLVVGGLGFGSVTVATGHTCGLTTDETAYCWGINGSGGQTGGNLGDGTTIDRFTPVPVEGGLSFTAVSAGGDHTCGLTTAGDAYCWGNNQSGELGTGTFDGSTVPIKVARQ